MDEVILKYLNETATDNELKQLLKWLDEKEENQQYFSEIRDLWLASAKPFANISEDIEAFSLFKKNALAYELRQKGKRFTLKWLSTAAAVLLLICSVGSYYAGQKSITLQTVDVLINQTITGAGNKGIVTLPDGTLVWLNSNSKLIYPEKFTSNVRKVTLEGEGYFEVVSNKNAPFYVDVENMTVKVVGTHFNVQSYKQKERSETVLLSGKVEILCKNTGKTIALSPNQKILFDKKQNNYTIQQVHAADYALWKEEKLTFDNEELGVILRKIGYWYGVDMTYGKDIPVNAKYSLAIRNESREDILKTLSIIAPINYKIENEHIFINLKK